MPIMWVNKTVLHSQWILLRNKKEQDTNRTMWLNFKHIMLKEKSDIKDHRVKKFHLYDILEKTNLQ